VLAYLAVRIGMGIIGLLPYGTAIARGRRRAGRSPAWTQGGGRWSHATPGASVSPRKTSPTTSVRRLRPTTAATGRRRSGSGRAASHSSTPGTTDEGLHFIEEARDAGRGIIFALPHMGNWEYAAPIAARLGIEVVAVAEDLRNRRIRDWFLRLRNSMGIGIILATGSAQVMRELEAVIAAQRHGGAAVRSRSQVAKESKSSSSASRPPSRPDRLRSPSAPAHRLHPVATYFDGKGHHVVVSPCSGRFHPAKTAGPG
jgi:hypothetical protein